MNYLLPLSIIAIGVLLLLGSLDILSINQIWDFLLTWWPAIIILAGIRMLVQDIERRKAAKKPDSTPPSVGGP